MLVKFLSYAASVVGSARHRAVLASCFVLIVAFAGILSIPFMHNAPKAKLVGSAQDEPDTDGQSETVWLSERQLQQKGPQEQNDTETSPKSTENKAENTKKTEIAAEEPEANESSAELNLSKTEIVLEPGNGSSDISASVNKKGDITWSITADKSAQSGDIIIENGEKSESSTSFRVRAASNIKPGTYRVTVAAKSSDLNLTRTLTVIVQ